jgi:hypothetical protein
MSFEGEVGRVYQFRKGADSKEAHVIPILFAFRTSLGFAIGGLGLGWFIPFFGTAFHADS